MTTLPSQARMPRAVHRAVEGLANALRPLRTHVTVKAVHEARAKAHQLVDTLRTYDNLRLPLLEKQCALLKASLGVVRDLHVRGKRSGRALRRATSALRNEMGDYERLGSRLEHQIARELTASPANAERLRKRLRARLRKLKWRIERLPDDPTPKRAHRLRVRIKRAHHAVSILSPNRRGLLARLKAAAVPLGRLHDFDAGLHAGGGRRVEQIFPSLERLSQAL